MGIKMGSTNMVVPNFFPVDAIAPPRGKRKRNNWLQKTPRPRSRSPTALAELPQRTQAENAPALLRS